MDLLYKAKLRCGLITVEKRMEKYYDIEKSVDLLKGERDDLMKENGEMKYIAEKNLQKLAVKNGNMGEKEKEYLVKAINDKYNKYFSKYLDDVKDIKNKIDKAKKEQNTLFKGNTAIYLNRIRKEEELSRYENYKYKDFTDSGLNRARESMPQIDSEHLDSFLMHFANKAKVTKDKMKFNEMKPSQKDFNNQKVLDMYKKGSYKSHKYIVSKDGFMMDGHHNWAAGLEDDPNKEVDVYKINLPIKDLLRRANMLNISTKKDINDKEITKSIITIVEAYKAGKMTEEDFDKTKKQILTKGDIFGDYINIIRVALEKAKEEKEVRPINRDVLNPDDGKPQKASRDYVMYNDKSPSKTGKEYCGNCAWILRKRHSWDGGHECAIVEGEINRKGWCTLWGIDLLLPSGQKSGEEVGVTKESEVEKLEEVEKSEIKKGENEVEKVSTPADTKKEEINTSHDILTMWQLEKKLKSEGKIAEGQSLVFFCPVYFPGQKIVEALLNREDEHGEKMLFPLPMIKDTERVKVGLEQMKSLGIENPEQYITEDKKKGGKGLLTYSSIPGIEGVHNEKYEYIANEFVQLGAFQIVPNEWVNQGDPINDTYKIPGEEGYSPYWRIPSFEEFKKLRPDLAKNYKETDEGIIKKFEKEEEGEEEAVWKHKESFEYANKLKEKFGKPVTEGTNIMIWENIAGFDRVEVRDESIDHDFPKPHKDFVYSYLSLTDEEVKKMQDLIDDLSKVTGSIFFDGLKKEMGARCGMLIKNADTLTYIMSVLAGEIEPTKENYSEIILGDKFGEWYKDEMGEKKKVEGEAGQEIEKGIADNKDLEKAYTEGTYSNTPENRKLGRVGEKYSVEKEDSSEGKKIELNQKQKDFLRSRIEFGDKKVGVIHAPGKEGYEEYAKRTYKFNKLTGEDVENLVIEKILQPKRLQTIEGGTEWNLVIRPSWDTIEKLVKGKEEEKDTKEAKDDIEKYPNFYSK